MEDTTTPPQPEQNLAARIWQHLRSPGSPLPKLPWRTALAVLALLIAISQAGKFFQRSLRSVEPGSAGLCVNRLTGHLAVLLPGAYFRPGFLYEIHGVRISDRLLSGPGTSFSVSSKEGVSIHLTVAARWAVDRKTLLAKWAALPADPAQELVSPILASAFRTVAPRYEVARIISEKREELAAVSAKVARERLLDSGIVLKEVLINDLILPGEYERARIAMVEEQQNTDRMEVTLKLKAREVEKDRLEGEAVKAKIEKNAEAAAAQRVIAARGESDAMKYVLALKEKEIQQRKLEAEAEKEQKLKRAQADAEVSRIQSAAEVERRKVLADAEAYAIRATSAAQFENLKREAELVQQNPLLIPKTFADRLSDRVQVILTPTIGGEAFTGEVLKRVANGDSPVATDPPPSKDVSRASLARKPQKEDSDGSN
jgi:regulator of protease activity HflC (stomatin/prohibitin superfamily)